MTKYWKLIICALAMVVLCACEKKNEDVPGGDRYGTYVQFVNQSGLKATCSIVLNDSNASGKVLLNAEPFGESNWVNLSDDLHRIIGPIGTIVSVRVWDTMPLNQRELKENVKYDFQEDQTYQITLDRQAKFFFIGQKND